ncbi:MAG: type VI immunity family protein [Vicinamibacterales bacterium]
MYLRPCLEVTLFWSGPAAARAAGIVKFYDESLKLIRDGLAFYRTETMSAAKRLKKDTLGLVPFWFQDTKTRRDVYMMFLESGAAPDEPSDRAFALNASPNNGFVRLILPVAYAAKSAAPFLDVALRLGQTIEYDFGQAGLALNWNHLGDHGTPAKEAMNALASRYPGLDISHPFSTKYIASKGFKAVNWLTFLSMDYVERLGGLSALRKAFDKDVVVHEQKHGVAIQAGPAPELGDVNRRKTLPVYHQVGRVLAPIRAKDHPPIFGPEGIQDKEVTEKWLSRFDS